MKDNVIRRSVVAVVLVVSFGLVASQTVLAAEKDLPPGVAKKDNIPGKGKHKGLEQGKHEGWDKKSEAVKPTEDLGEDAGKEEAKIDKEAEGAAKKTEKEKRMAEKKTDRTAKKNIA